MDRTLFHASAKPILWIFHATHAEENQRIVQRYDECDNLYGVEY